MLSFQSYYTQLGTIAGTVNYIQCGISTSTSNIVGGGSCYAYNNSGQQFTSPFSYNFVLNNSSIPLIVTSASQVYYYVTNPNYASITLQLLGSLNNIQITRIA